MDTHIFTSLDEFFYTQAYTTSLTKDSKIMASKNIKHNYMGPESLDRQGWGQKTFVATPISCNIQPASEHRNPTFLDLIALRLPFTENG